MADLYLSAKQKLAHARSRIAALESEIEAFNATEPHERVVETDPEGLIQEHRVRLIRSLPDGLADTTVEAAEALHTALDHAVFAASKQAGSHRLLDTCFPLARDSAGLEKAMEEKCKGVPEEIAKLIRSFEPYPGGNDLIAGLAAIEAAEKYALVVPWGTVDSRLIFSNNQTSARVQWDAEHKEIKLGFFPIHGKFHRDINIFFTAAFGEIGVLENRLVVPTLKAATEEVERIIGILEGAASRIDLTAE